MIWRYSFFDNSNFLIKKKNLLKILYAYFYFISTSTSLFLQLEAKCSLNSQEKNENWPSYKCVSDLKLTAITRSAFSVFSKKSKGLQLKCGPGSVWILILLQFPCNFDTVSVQSTHLPKRFFKFIFLTKWPPSFCQSKYTKWYQNQTHFTLFFLRNAALRSGAATLPRAGSQLRLTRRKIRLREGNAKCRHLKKITCKETLQQVFISLWPKTLYPPPL